MDKTTKQNRKENTRPWHLIFFLLAIIPFIHTFIIHYTGLNWINNVLVYNNYLATQINFTYVYIVCVKSTRNTKFQFCTE